jgi:hypothetical protein
MAQYATGDMSETPMPRLSQAADSPAIVASFSTTTLPIILSGP